MAITGMVSMRSTNRIRPRVDPAPEVAGDGADEHADERGEEGDDQRDLDRLLGAPQHLGEVVVAEVVGAERVLPRRRLAASGVSRLVVVLPDAGADERQQRRPG